MAHTIANSNPTAPARNTSAPENRSRSGETPCASGSSCKPLLSCHSICDAGIECVKLLEGSDKQARARQQQRAEGNFEDDERLPAAPCSAGSSRQNRSPDYFRIAREPPLPETVGQDGGLRIFGCRQPAIERLHSECGKVVVRHQMNADSFGRPGIRQSDIGLHVAEDVAQHRGSLAQRRVNFIRQVASLTEVGKILRQADQLIRLANGQPPKEQRIQRAEDDAACADAQREEQRRHQRESRIVSKAAYGVSQIAHVLVCGAGSPASKPAFQPAFFEKTSRPEGRLAARTGCPTCVSAGNHHYMIGA